MTGEAEARALEAELYDLEALLEEVLLPVPKEWRIGMLDTRDRAEVELTHDITRSNPQAP